MEGYLTLTAPEFAYVISRLKPEDYDCGFDRLYGADVFGPPWHFGNDGNLYIQEVN